MLRRRLRSGALDDFDVLDFHRVEPIGLFLRDTRPKNVVIHQDMADLRNAKSDIRWRYAPGLYDAVERSLLRRVDRVFCVRQSAVHRYVTRDPSLTGRACFIPTWVDTTVFAPAQASGESPRQIRRDVFGKLGIARTARLLISVGRLDHQKAPLLLLEAFRAVLRTRGDVHLAIVGDGILRRKVENACAANDLKGRVTTLGARPASEIVRLLRASDLFVLASAYEGMPIAMLEALATGVPVVGTDVGEVRLILREGVNGRIAARRTPEALAGAIHQALAQLPQLPPFSAVTAGRRAEATASVQSGAAYAERAEERPRVPALGETRCSGDQVGCRISGAC